MTQQPNRRSCSYWFRLLAVGLTGGVLLAAVGYLIMSVHALTKPAPSEICCSTPTDLGFDYEEISFVGFDGAELQGWYIPSQNGAAVILLHGYGANRTENLFRAAMLAEHGFGALLYDLRAHGQSGGELRSYGWLDVKDVPAAIEFLNTREEVDPERIGILGFSIGGQVAIRAAVELPELKAVIADGPGIVNSRDYPPAGNAGERLYVSADRIVDWAFSLRLGEPVPEPVVEVISEISPRPLLLMAGSQDTREQRLSQHYFDAAGEPKELWFIPGAGHGGGPMARPDEYKEKIATFFSEALLPSD